MKKAITFFSFLSLFSLFTGILFAEESQSKFGKSSVYINVSQMFGKNKLTGEYVDFESPEYNSKGNMGDMKYGTNFALGFSQGISNKFSVGVQFLISMMKDYKDYDVREYEGFTTVQDVTFSNTTGASFLTVDYDVFNIDRFTTSVNAGLGLAIHALSYDYNFLDISSSGKSSESSSVSNTSATLAYQIGVTEAVKLINNIDLTLGVSYVNLGSPSLNISDKDGKTTYKLKNNGYVNTTIGLKFNF